MDPMSQILALLGFILAVGLSNLGIALYLLGKTSK